MKKKNLEAANFAGFFLGVSSYCWFHWSPGPPYPSPHTFNMHNMHRFSDCFLYSIFSLDQALSWSLHGLMGATFTGRSTVVLPCETG
jgi:hypothetical protein